MRLGFGTAQAGAYPALGQVTRTWFPSSIRTVVQGLVASFSGRSGAACASIIMATFLMGWLEMTWRQALATLTAAGVVFGIAFLMLYRKSPEDDPRVNEAELELIREGEQTTGKPGILPFGRAFRNNTLRLLFSQQFLNAGADIAYTSFIGAYFAAQKVDIKAFGWLVAMPFIGGALGGAFGGIANDWLIPRLGRRWARSAIGFAGKFVAALTVFVLVQQTTPVAAGIWLLIVKFFSDWTQPTVWGTCTDVGGKFSATIFSINNTSGNAAAFVLPPLYGMLLDFYSTTHTVDGKTVRDTNFIPLFIVIAGMYLIVATAWLFIDCTKKLELTESQTPLETSEE
ncbi:MAG: hypothetical protein KatS3mg105_3260 [Gemmatales bacterium]|nr:MAG: hypothetical protein KatS3mg105_3260 [Gemmatales bacterium]